MKCWEAAVQILRETGNPAVMTGDAFLLHAIHDLMAWPQREWPQSLRVEKKVLDALTNNPGILIPKKTLSNCGRGGAERAVRIFRLPESDLK